MDQKVQERIRKELQGQHKCFVVLTCSQADGEGQMQVDFMYDGDPLLVSYLLEGAVERVDELVEDGEEASPDIRLYSTGSCE